MTHLRCLLASTSLLFSLSLISCGGGGPTRADTAADLAVDLRAESKADASTDSALDVFMDGTKPDLSADDVLGDAPTEVSDVAPEVPVEVETDVVAADAGCTGAESCPTGLACRADGSCGPCSSADECRTSEACREPGEWGECGACRVADECRAGQACGEDGICGPCGAEDASCSGLLCKDAECVACEPAVDDAACAELEGEGFFCNESGRCTTSCVDLFDCLVVGRVCDETSNTCLPCQGPDACEEAGYGLGTPCVAGVCVETSCTTSAECSATFPERPICGADATCRPCATHDECSAVLDLPGVCQVTGRCTAGTCGGFDDLPCAGDDAGKVCLDSTCAACANGPEALVDDCLAHGYEAGVLCVEGLCATAECNEVQGCEAPRYCSEYACVECNDDETCPASKPICDANVCRPCAQGECGAGRVCVSGECLDGDCWLEGQVWPAGPKSDDEPCRVCDPTTPNAWQPASGVACDDGSACTYGDTCGAAAGVCMGTAYTCPGSVCANGVCHGTGPADCTEEKKASWDGCLVDAECYLTTDPNPANPCEVCNGSTGTWMSRELGAPCGSGKCRSCQEEDERVVCRFVPPGLDPRNQCTAPCEVCDGQGECRWVDPKSDPGPDPNNDCLAEPVGTCGRNGSCVGGSDACAWWVSDAGVDDGNECTILDRCNGEGGKTGDAVPDGTACWALTKVCRQGECGDCLHNEECPESRVCSSGSCVVGSCTNPDQCGVPPSCYRNTCIGFQCGLESDDAVACSDDNPCTTNDYCLAGVCRSGADLSCTFLDTDCSYGACDPADAQCHSLPRDDGSTCNDGDPCTEENCQAGKCQASPKCSDDGLWCTTDCVNGSCAFQRQESTCLIDDVCYHHGDVQPDHPCYECVSTGGAGKPNDWSFDASNTCTDNIDCTVDSCQVAGCQSVEDDALCDEGLPWTFHECNDQYPGCIERGWAHVVGSNAYAADAITTSDGGVLLVGMFYGLVDFDPGPGKDEQGAVTPATQSLFVTRLDEKGTYLWTRSCTPMGSGIAQAASVALTSEGNIIVGGDFTGTLDFDPGSQEMSMTAEAEDGFVLQLDSEGSFVDAFQIGGGEADSVSFVRVDELGSLHIAGKFRGTVDFDPALGGAGALTAASGKTNWFVAAYGQSGSLQYVSGLLGETLDAKDMVVTPDGKVLLAGRFKGGTDFDPGPETAAPSAAAQGEGFILKLRSTGSFDWLREFNTTGTGGQSSVRAIFLMDEGGILATGDYRAKTDLDPGEGEAFFLGGDYWSDAKPFVVRLDSSGSLVVAKGYGLMNNQGTDVLVRSGEIALLTYDFGDGATVSLLDGDLDVKENRVILSHTSGMGEIEVQQLLVMAGRAAMSGHYKTGFDLDPTTSTYDPTNSDSRYSFVYASDIPVGETAISQ